MAVRHFVCEECEKPFTSRGSRERKYCSKGCSSVALGRLRRKKKETRSCLHCGKEFKATKWSKKKFCRKGCATAHASASRRQNGWETKACEWCGEEFSAPKSRKKRFCSRLCGNRHVTSNRRVELVELRCEFCSTPFRVKPHAAETRRFCSQDCVNKHVGRENVLVTKTRSCGECGAEVGVPRNVSDAVVRCPEHRAVLAKDTLKTCEGCGKDFIAKKGRLKTHRFCSRLCACRHVATQNGAVLKTSSCQTCGEDVVVPRSTADAHTFCEKHRKQNRKKARRRQYYTSKPINQPANAPYLGHELQHLEFDQGSQHWFVLMVHLGTKQEQKVLLAKYILEAQRGRFLREDEKVHWKDGDEKNDSPSNLGVRLTLSRAG